VSEELKVLQDRIERQKSLLEHWRQPIEPLLFETLRAIDFIFCQELFFPEGSLDRMGMHEYALSTWGVNQALARMMPDELGHGAFRLFPSNPTAQKQADEFLLQSGILERAELLRGWIKEGLVSARLDTPPHPLPSGIEKILVLKTDDPFLFREVVARKHREWISDLTMEHDRSWEELVENRHRELQPELEKNLEVFQDWGISYSTTKEIDDHFLECGQLYLRRMWSQDLLGLDDRIGGNQFNEYLGVLAAISGRAQKHLCFASMLKQRNPALDLRNLLTTFTPYDEFITALSRHLDAETLQIQKLLSSLTLEPSNREVHTASLETAWAPIVRSSHDNCILPLYGLEINPFLFLLRDLQAKYPDDWFRAANNREKRWIDDLRHIFPGDRWSVIDRNFKLREGGRVLTDLDFIAYDSHNNELAIFQLKWQQPVGMDNRARRSAGKNLVTEGNKWIEAVCGWLDRLGVEELARRAGIAVRSDVHVTLFVVARYNAFFSGYADLDDRGAWADWNHLIKARSERPKDSVRELAVELSSQVQEIASSFPGESYMVPIADLAIILNPTSEPEVLT